MEGNGWRPAQGDPTTATSAAAAAIAGADPSAVDWRGQLQPEARHRIVNKIMETLKRHLPFSVSELHKIAVRFEEKIYSAATSQGDYLKKISLKMLSMELKAHPTPSMNSGMSAGAVQPQNPGDPALSIPQQVSNQTIVDQSIFYAPSSFTPKPSEQHFSRYADSLLQSIFWAVVNDRCWPAINPTKHVGHVAKHCKSQQFSASLPIDQREFGIGLY